MRLLSLLTLLVAGCGAYEGAKSNFAGPQAAKRGKISAGEASDSALPGSGAIQRKIVYTIDAALVVEDFDEVPKKVEELVGKYKGEGGEEDAYVSNSNIASSPHRPRRGQWTIRVPVSRYEDFLLDVRELGEVHNVRRDSKDVTEEYVDVDRRIKTRQATAERLTELKGKTAELNHLLEVDRELSRVLEEIERLQGRMNVLNNLTSMTTFNLTIDEIKDYVPEEAVGYGTRLRRSLGKSLGNLWETAQAASIGLIAALPWIVVIVVLAILVITVLYYVLRCLGKMLARRRP